MVEAASRIDLPDLHSQPFFYTIQLNQDTRERQLKLWAEILLSYAKSQGKMGYSVQELYESEGVCVNKKVNRRLSIEAVGKVMEYMVEKGLADYSADDGTKDKVFIYAKPLQTIATAIFTWADRNCKIGSVETLVDLREDSSVKGEIFHMLDIKIIEKACLALQKEGKAEVFELDVSGLEGTKGVKFFHQ
ncbi:hypothetical protein FGO68_gene12395 [Halteria grandinella]|uniref:ESCRT-II complex subunit VPS25 n=1 Tax=Halteria grandinella TaxID=5974 RepID=A0A8J8NPJ9_HALGN|nr:hypothetical protein FGO68_gene12395 [Halteria grandinella]